MIMAEDSATTTTDTITAARADDGSNSDNKDNRPDEDETQQKEKTKKKKKKKKDEAAPTFWTIPTQSFVRSDLEILNLLEHPIWIFDIIHSNMYWANTAALTMWNAETVEELMARDFQSDMSETIAKRLEALHVRLSNGEIIKETWTFYPKGKATTVASTERGIRVEEDGHIVCLSEGNLVDVYDKVEESTVRHVEMLRHLPVPVCQYSLQGTLKYENPESMKVFGSKTTAAGSSNSSTTGNSTASTTTHANQDDDEKLLPDESEDVTASPSSSTTAPIPAEKNDQDKKRPKDTEDHADHPNDTTTTTTTTTTTSPMINDFLSRFVDVSVGEEALKTVRNGLDFTGEAQQMVQMPVGVGGADDEEGTEATARWFSLAVRPRKDPVTSEPILLYSAQDITEVIQARDLAKQATLKSEFLSVVAHEIRTPLHQMIGYMDLLELTRPLLEQQMDYIGLVQSCAACLLAIINDILDYSKLESGRIQLEHITFGLSGILEACMDSFEGKAMEKGVTLECEALKKKESNSSSSSSLETETETKTDSSALSAADMTLKGDPNRLRQILLNLLSNAIKFTSKGGTVTLRVRRIDDDDRDGDSNDMQSNDDENQDEKSRSTASLKMMRRKSSYESTTGNAASEFDDNRHVNGDSSNRSLGSNSVRRRSSNTSRRRPCRIRFEVEDTGIGIEPSQQKLLFQRYQQANAAVTRQYGGTGLGLAICKGLVEAHDGGTIGMTSQVGKGTCVWFELPYELLLMEDRRDSTLSQDSLASSQGKRRSSSIQRLYSDVIPDSLSPPTGKSTNTNGTDLPSTTSTKTTTSSISKSSSSSLSFRILVAEDNKVNQKVVRAMLNRIGHSVTIVEDGKAAVEELERQVALHRTNSGDEQHDYGYDVVLMDIQMPVMDGERATEEIRALGYDIPIIGLTAGYLPSDLEHYRNIGMDTCIGKPIRLKDLKQVLLDTLLED